MQDAYDDLMRRKLNPQKPEYVQNNELVCFGVSEHTLEENIPQWNEKALTDFHIVSTSSVTATSFPLAPIMVPKKEDGRDH